MQYIVDNLWMIWIIVSIALLLLELTSGEFFVLCFSVGALAAFVVSLFSAPIWLQVLLWAVTSVVCLVFVRPWLRDKLHIGADNRRSNADALIGKRGRVIETVQPNGFGYVKIDGDEWRSVSEDGIEIPKDALVEVVSRDSIVLTVKLINNK